MEEKSRVIKYQELRRQIDNFDVYSFDKPLAEEEFKELPPIETEKPLTEAELHEQHVKKNTLSISIQDLIKAHEDYTTSISKDEIKKEVIKNKAHLKINWAILLWVLLIVILLALIIVVICSLGGAF